MSNSKLGVVDKYTLLSIVETELGEKSHMGGWKMLVQRLLATIDILMSKVYRFESWDDSSPNGESTWLYCVGQGKRVGIVGADGKVHTILGSRTVRHYYRRRYLTRRILVRKDLKEGERLATQREIDQYQDEARERWSEAGGLTFI